MSSVGNAVHAVNIYTNIHVSSRPIVYDAKKKKGREGTTHIWKQRKAILGLTPGSKHSSLAVLGASHSSRRRRAVYLIYLNSSVNAKAAVPQVGKRGVLKGLTVSKAHLKDAIRDDVLPKQQAASQS